jgi:lipoprotein signal peptidase
MMGRLPKLRVARGRSCSTDHEVAGARILSLYESRTVIPGLVDLVHVRNEGAAFGLLNNLDIPYKSVRPRRWQSLQ